MFPNEPTAILTHVICSDWWYVQAIGCNRAQADLEHRELLDLLQMSDGLAPIILHHSKKDSAKNFSGCVIGKPDTIKRNHVPSMIINGFRTLPH